MRTNFRKICAVLMALTMLHSAAYALVFDYELDQYSNLKITGSVDSNEAGEKVYIQVINQGTDSENLLDISNLDSGNYKQLINMSVVVESGASPYVGGNFGYTYKMTSPEGYFKIRVNDGTGVQEQQFYYVSPEERQRMVDELKDRTLTPDVDTLKTKILSVYKKPLNVDTNVYDTIKDSAEKNVPETIFTSIFNNISNVTDANSLLKLFEKEVLIQQIDLADVAGVEAFLTDDGNAVFIGFDLETSGTYNLLSETGKNAFYSALASQSFDSSATFLTKVREVLLLTAIDNAVYWGDINTFIEEHKDIIPFNYERYNNHSNRNQIDHSLTGNSYTLATLEATIDLLSKPTVPGNSGINQGGTTGGGNGGGLTIPSTNKNEDKVDDSNTDIPVTTPPVSIKFEDIKDHWAKEYIEKLADVGVINGVTETEFLPYNNVKREEFIKMLVTLFELETDANDSYAFSDVSAEHWSYSYLTTAKKYGITQGYEGNCFGLGDDITREDMMVLLSRVCHMKNVEMFTLNQDITFDDYNTIEDYAKDAVIEFAKKGVVSGFEDGSFRGKQPATRGETAKILSAFLDYII